MRVNRKIVGVLVGCFLWTLVVRSPTFLRSAVDWDEGLYVLMASQWLGGHPPYSTVFENKPVGIFAIFAVALEIFGESVASIRLMTVVVVWATSAVLLLIAKRLLRDEHAGLIAAISYPILSLGLQGVSSNTELFFIFFNVLGLLFLLLSISYSGIERGKTSIYALAAGLSFGAAVQIKYIVAVEIALFVAYFVVVRYRSVRHAPMILAMLVTGGILPSLAAIAYLWARDVLDLFIVANIDTNQRYVTSSSGADIWTGLSHAFEDWFKWVWTTVMALVFLGVRARRVRGTEPVLGFLLMWLVVGFVEAGLTLKFFKHYYLVTMPPLCLLLAHASARFSAAGGRPRILALALVVALGYPLARAVEKTYVPWVAEYLAQGDVNVNIARYLKGRIAPGDFIYVVNGQPIIYFLAKAQPPTRYVLPPMIISEPSNRVVNVDYPGEVDRILGKGPRAVLIKRNHERNARVDEIEARLQRDYIVGTKIADTAVYIRKPRSGEPEASE